VHDRVTGLAVGGVLPAAALPRGNRAQAAAWWRGFRFEVIRDAQRLGPSRNRCSRPAQLALQVAAVLPAAVAAAAVAPADSDPVSLLTAEEVSAAFGRPLGPPRSLTGDGTLPFLGVRMCEYAAVGDRASVQVQTVTGRIARALLERVRGEPLPASARRRTCAATRSPSCRATSASPSASSTSTAPPYGSGCAGWPPPPPAGCRPRNGPPDAASPVQQVGRAAVRVGLCRPRSGWA
jgi:hypothetical protein